MIYKHVIVALFHYGLARVFTIFRKTFIGFIRVDVMNAKYVYMVVP